MQLIKNVSTHILCKITSCITWNTVINRFKFALKSKQVISVLSTPSILLLINSRQDHQKEVGRAPRIRRRMGEGWVLGEKVGWMPQAMRSEGQTSRLWPNSCHLFRGCPWMCHKEVCCSIRPRRSSLLFYAPSLLDVQVRAQITHHKEIACC